MDAEALLARIDWMEENVTDGERELVPLEKPVAVSEMVVACERQLLAEAYRRAIGVFPWQRTELRDRLTELVETGEGDAEEIVAEVARRQPPFRAVGVAPSPMADGDERP